LRRTKEETKGKESMKREGGGGGRGGGEGKRRGAG
jgi:hypothetical protein